MSLNYVPQTLPASEFERVFAQEQARSYPVVDVFEQQMGFAVDRGRLEAAARVLECPVKASPPSWQHGRVLYAAARRYFEDRDRSGWMNMNALDIGTAKGFSALCLYWAMVDAGCIGQVTSVDVLQPDARVRRNTIAEVDRLQTLAEILAPWPEAEMISFQHSSSLDWLKAHPEPVHVAFVDGKHTGDVVRQEGKLLAARQQSGDLTIFDDVHIPEVSVAVNSLQSDYRISYMELLPQRHYAIARRR